MIPLLILSTTKLILMTLKV